MMICEEVVPLPVLGADVGHDVLVEELEDERDAVGEHQVLRDDLKLSEGGRKVRGWRRSRLQFCLKSEGFA